MINNCGIVRAESYSSKDATEKKKNLDLMVPRVYEYYRSEEDDRKPDSTDMK